jgi:hypothetical protein
VLSRRDIDKYGELPVEHSTRVANPQCHLCRCTHETVTEPQLSHMRLGLRADPKVGAVTFPKPRLYKAIGPR